MAASLLAGSLLVLLNAVPWFTRWPISQLEVRGVRYAEVSQIVAVVQRQLSGRRYGVLPQWLTPFFNTREAQLRLQEQYPFASWSVNRRWFGGLLVTVEERRAKLVWISAHGAYYLDDQGVAFAPAASSEGYVQPSATVLRHRAVEEQLPVVADEQGGRLSTGRTAIAPRVVAFIVEVAHRLDDGSLPLNTITTGYRYHPESFRLTVQTARGYRLILTADQPAGSQLDKLQAVLRQGVAKRENLDYIDLRFGQKVFYR